ncbi:MAG TPA: tetraacyldisaccharide 4'-kinase [Gemmatimonadales bacterium]|nr:tetraacyldisaccharide 4'-kinase [Gemmatimonadales bacterium]
MARRGDTHRMLRWLWTSRRLEARLARAVLVPAAVLWRGGMAARAMAYQRGWLAVRELPLPSVSVGNLTLGGSGKGALVEWIARHYADGGATPAILVPGAPDEVRVHRHAVPGAIVLGDRDPVAGGERALAQGGTVLILDDAYQRLDVQRDLNLAVLSAETSRAVRWTLPAGPWREGWPALRRAQGAIVTRKRAPLEAAEQLARDLARVVPGPVGIVHLGLEHLEGLVSGERRAAATLSGKRVVAASAVADPDAFVAQTKATGAAVQVATWKDRPDFRDEDVAWLAHAARRADHVVITEKDAVKLRDRWPHRVPEPLVAVLQLAWEAGGEEIAAALDAVVTPADRF